MPVLTRAGETLGGARAPAPPSRLDAPFEALRLRAPTRSPIDLPQRATIIWKTHEVFGLSLPFARVRFQVNERITPNGDKVYVAYGRDKRTRSLAVTRSMLETEQDGKDPLDFARFGLESPSECDPVLEPLVRPLRYIIATFPMFHTHRVTDAAPLPRRIAGFDHRTSTSPRLRMERLYLDEVNTSYHCVDYKGQDSTGTNFLLKLFDSGGWEIISARDDAKEIDTDGRWVLEVYKAEARRPQLNAWLALCCAHAAEVKIVDFKTIKADDKGAATGLAVGLDDELESEPDDGDTTDTGSENSSDMSVALGIVRKGSVGSKLHDGERANGTVENTQDQGLEGDVDLAVQRTAQQVYMPEEIRSGDNLSTVLEKSDNPKPKQNASVATTPATDGEPVPDLEQSRTSQESGSYVTDSDTSGVATPRSPLKSTEYASPEVYSD